MQFRNKTNYVLTIDYNLVICIKIILADYSAVG
jgi:hypothetical protein